MRAIVSGGAGFIGSHLCASLIDQGIEVVCLDNLKTGSLRNLEPVLRDSRFALVEQDITEPLSSGYESDLVFHLASPASVRDYLSMPLETLRVNSLGTMNLLAHALESGARFLYASTSEVYGNPLVHPQPESYWGNVNPVGPRACYDESKRFGEAVTLEYCRSRRLDARIVRIFNTYGPHSRLDDGRVVPNFVVQALRREPLTIYGDGSQTRSLCYVSDMVGGIETAMLNEASRGEIFNLGNPDEHTILEFAEIVCNAAGSPVDLDYRPLPDDDPMRRCPDIQKARDVLGWEPKVDLAAGIRETIPWFRASLESGAAVPTR